MLTQQVLYAAVSVLIHLRRVSHFLSGSFIIVRRYNQNTQAAGRARERHIEKGVHNPDAEDGSTGVHSPDIIAGRTPPKTQMRTLSLKETRHARCTCC